MRSHSPGLRGRALKAALALAVGAPLVMLGVGAAGRRRRRSSRTPTATSRRRRSSRSWTRMVMPSAQSVWDAVAVDVTEKGTIEKKPQNDEEWAALRGTAVTLAEATNLLDRAGPPRGAAGHGFREPRFRADAREDRRAAEEPAPRLDRARARAARGRDGGVARDRRQEHRRRSPTPAARSTRRAKAATCSSGIPSREVARSLDLAEAGAARGSGFDAAPFAALPRAVC